MNKLGRIAMQHARTYRPAAYAEIEAQGDPIEHFTQVGIEADQRMADLTEEILQRAPQDDSYQGAVGARMQAKSQAREIVMAEYIMLPVEPGMETAELPNHGKV